MKRQFLVLFGTLVVLSVAGPASAQKSPVAAAPNPAAEVAIAEVSNGCGGGPASAAPRTYDTLTLTGADQKQYKVNFREACNTHDAGYSGAAVKDPAHGNKLVDFWDWTQEQVDKQLLADLQAACDRDLPSGDPAVAKCKGTPRGFGATCQKLANIDKAPLDAQDAFNVVSGCGGAFWKQRPSVAGDWSFTDASAPKGVVRIQQDAGSYAGQRHITAEWVPTQPVAVAAPSGLFDLTISIDISVSKFEGTLKTYDMRWEADGPVTFTITSDGKAERDVFQVALVFTLADVSADHSAPKMTLAIKACKDQDCTPAILTRIGPPKATN